MRSEHAAAVTAAAQSGLGRWLRFPAPLAALPAAAVAVLAKEAHVGLGERIVVVERIAVRRARRRRRRPTRLLVAVASPCHHNCCC